MPETVQLTRHDLTKAIFDARRRFQPELSVDPNAYVKLWKEDDVAEWGPTRALTLILRTRGCTWDYRHSCTMCGYFTDVLPKKLTSENLLTQYARAETQHAGEEVLKIYTGGNFLDDKEVFAPAQLAMLTAAAKRFKKVTVETRPEYITAATVQPLVDALAPAKFELAIGLESSNDEVCEKAINKGYGFREFVEGARIAHAAGARVKAYLLLKPPFLTEDEAVEDVVQSVKDAAPHADTLSINPTNVQNHTLVDQLYRRREYRPPWLWSILECVRRSRPHFTGVLKSDPVGGGKRRGAHNCGACDDQILPLLERYNATQDVAFVAAAEETACKCRATYDSVRRLEGFLGGSHFTD